MKNTNVAVPHGIDVNGNLLWIGGSVEKPWIVTMENPLSMSIDLVGGKVARNATVWRRIHGFDASSSDVQMAISEFLELKGDVVYGHALTHYGVWEFLKPHTEKLGNISELYDLSNIAEEEIGLLSDAMKQYVKARKISKELLATLRFSYESMKIDENHRVADRSSGTGKNEDSQDASMSGKNDSYLCIYGLDEHLKLVKSCIASQFNSGALSYKLRDFKDLFKLSHDNFVQQDNFAVFLCRMAKADVAGIIFSMDSTSKHDGFIRLSASWGLGEMVVGNHVNPDVFLIHKETLNPDSEVDFVYTTIGSKEKMMIPASKSGTKIISVSSEQRDVSCLSEIQVKSIARKAQLFAIIASAGGENLEAWDEEFAHDLDTEITVFTQIRPNTKAKKEKVIKDYEFYQFDEVSNPPIITGGISAGYSAIAAGVVCKVVIPHKATHKQIADAFNKAITEARMTISDEQIPLVLVIEMTYPSYETWLALFILFKTKIGGPDGHTSILAREQGKIAIVGLGKLFNELKTGQLITVDGRGAKGVNYDNLADVLETTTNVEGLKPSPIVIGHIVNNPQLALSQVVNFQHSDLNVKGAKLIRGELSQESLGYSSLAFNHFYELPMYFDKWASSQNDKKFVEKKYREFKKQVSEIEKLTAGSSSPRQWAIDYLAHQNGLIAAAYYPEIRGDRDAYSVLRQPDFKVNEQGDQQLGYLFFEELKCENPHFAVRGAKLFNHPIYRDTYMNLDLEVFRTLYFKMGFRNLVTEVPFVRDVSEFMACKEMMAEKGIIRGQDGIKIKMMLEVVENFMFIEDYIHETDGVAVGGNDLLGGVRSDERDGDNSISVPKMIRIFEKALTPVVNERTKEFGNRAKQLFPIDFCGNQPSTHSDFARALYEKQLVDSITIIPNRTFHTIAAINRQDLKGRQEQFVIRNGYDRIPLVGMLQEA